MLGEIVKRELHAGGMGDGQQMQHGIGGTAQGNHHRDGVLKGFAAS